MRKVALACFVVALGVLVVWLVQGRQLVTLTEQMVKEKVVDEFGDTETKVHWKPTLKIGLMDAAGPAMGGTVSVGAVLLWLARRRDRRRAGQAELPERASP